MSFAYIVVQPPVTGPTASRLVCHIFVIAAHLLNDAHHAGEVACPMPALIIAHYGPTALVRPDGRLRVHIETLGR